jgi:hypothetical protein
MPCLELLVVSRRTVVVVVVVMMMMMMMLMSTSVLWAKYMFGSGEDLMPTQWLAMVCEKYIDGGMEA